MPTLPRLSTALQAFGESLVSGEENTTTSLADKRDFCRKREEARMVTWPRLQEILLDISPESMPAWRKFHKRMEVMLGREMDWEAIYCLHLPLFRIFRDQEHWSLSLVDRVKGIVGPIEQKQVKALHQTSREIFDIMTEEQINKVANFDEINGTENSSAEMFGQKVRFHFNQRARLLSLCSIGSVEESDSGGLMEELLVRGATGNFELNDRNVLGATAEMGNSFMHENGVKAEGNDEMVDRTWLATKLQGFAPKLGIPAGQLVERTASVLLSERANDAIQNELFDLLGYDGFDIIGELLRHRSRLINGCGDAPTISISNGNAPAPTGVLDLLANDPLALVEKRRQQLSKAPSVPPPRSASTKKSFPFVFDQLADASKSAAYIGSAKIHLPVDHERKTDRLYEQVRFPPGSKGSLQAVEARFPRVAISRLDEVAQMAFAGMKELNLIQSVVFESAYKSNENLLVCAPTGAGKTNVALLTIVHELKQHIGPGGKVKKEDFKIVYIAPMKALAAEMTANFGRRLKPLGISVRECTGDMQLTKSEILDTQMLVVTPEKWDVMTRKSTGDVSLVQIVKLLIIDEVHLLHEDRGAVIESLVARTLRQVEMSQRMIRIVGLSATLPNYTDVASFLRVNPSKGLFFFDSRFRPVPLGQTFIGVKTKSKPELIKNMNMICYERVFEQVRQGEQVMVFVHARQETKRTAFALREIAQGEGTIKYFAPEENIKTANARKLLGRSRNSQLKDMFESGFAMHHAGMLRSDRNIVERIFSEGSIRCLVCTATLAWGVNLPAHAVIIKGTQIYDAEKSSFVDLGILDVLQIFGRAGRPQFDRIGFGTIITTHDKLGHYLSLMCRANPIESQFVNSLIDNLNAEIALGSVTNVEEAVKWLSFTYLFVRMRVNPMAYGITYQAKAEDPLLQCYRRDLIINAGRKLDKARMIRFDERTEYFACTDLGRTASHYYIKYPTVETINDLLRPQMMDPDMFDMVAQSQEFAQIKVREEEMDELTKLQDDSPVLVRSGPEHVTGKVNILMQAYISRLPIETFSLISDQMYIQQNAARIVRALFEIALRRGWPLMSYRLLILSKTVERQVWADQSCPMAQFVRDLRPEVLRKVEHMRLDVILEHNVRDFGALIRDMSAAKYVKGLAECLPRLQLEASLQPITRTILRVRLSITPEFRWNDRQNGKTNESFWIWVEDPDNDHIYHYEYFLLSKKQVQSGESQTLIFTIPIFEPLPSQYIVRAISDRWLACEAVLTLSFHHLILPQSHPPHTELLDLQPLPRSALADPQLEALYTFSHFNPIQTQIFHSLYHSDSNILLGAPTGSGKTVAAELAIFRVFREHPGKRCVYIAPLKALVRERIEDWKIRFEERLGKKVVELTGDVTPDMRAVSQADVIVTTPEKWDGVSRSWQQRSFVQDVALIVIDEIHLLGDERGPVLEVIVSRTNFIASHTAWPVRVVGLSTALANARDLANWLGISTAQGMFNFRPSVRPVPLEVHIQGYAGRHYCPRMATMNKPIFQAIRTHSPAQPVLIFVSSRRQTRLTALDLIAFLAGEDDPKQWLGMPEEELEAVAQGVRDTNLRLTLAFGIGLHHAGLQEKDRKLVEELFVHQRIQVLVATSTLAWGVNFPAHLVIVKGTEFFDGKSKRYVDYPITDVLQMMGRAGRPQFDNEGKAVVMVHDIKKHFYKRFLYEPFPVESNLLAVLPDHLNAEIVAGTVKTKQDAVDYITWTYFFRRLVMNPTFYELSETDHQTVNNYLSKMVEKCILELEASSCVSMDEDGFSLAPLSLGRIASYYYLNHETVKLFNSEIRQSSSLTELLEILSNTAEYATLPVRHNEDQLNTELAKHLPIKVGEYSMDSSHTKTNLLLQAHFCRQQLPLADYVTDTKSVLDQAIRILQGMIDASAEHGWLATSLRCVHLIQMVLQGRWLDDSSLLTMPHIEEFYLPLFHDHNIHTIPELIQYVGPKFQTLTRILGDVCSREELDKIFHNLRGYPCMEISLSMSGEWEGRRDTRSVPSTSPNAGPVQRRWFDVHADGDYTLEVQLTKLNHQVQRRALAPKFPKPKDEGWILMLGEVEAGELWAVKRVPVIRQRVTTVPLAFITPPESGRTIYTLYVMSDSYLGLDQQIDICLNVHPECRSGQDDE